MMLNIQSSLDDSINNKQVRVIIISSEGPTFSAGHDLKELTLGPKNPDKGKAYFKEIMTKCSKLMRTIVNNPKPIIFNETRGSAQVKSSVMLAALNTNGETIIKAKKSRNHTELLCKYLKLPIKIKEKNKYCHPSGAPVE